MVSNLGLAFNVHYCEDKIESISLKITPATQGELDECCGIVEKDTQCCNDKIIKAEIKSDQIIVKTLAFDTNFIFVENNKPNFTTLSCNLKKLDKLTYYCDANAPPLYLLYSQYTFYA